MASPPSWTTEAKTVTGAPWPGCIAMGSTPTPNRYGAAWPGCMTATLLTAVCTGYRMRLEGQGGGYGPILHRFRLGSGDIASLDSNPAMICYAIGRGFLFRLILNALL